MLRLLPGAARPATARSTALHFMPNVKTSALLPTAFAIAPADGKLRLVLP